jgi:His/Glu/Gln/Arg/opine family amino acid ABC transporter permease subunit
MTTASDPFTNPKSANGTKIYPTDPPSKSPPVLEVGALAWIRRNLLRTWFDAILTIISTFLIVTVVTAIVRWAIGSANWYVITFNLRLFMLGRLDAEYEWRIQIIVLMFAFVGGFGLAAYSRMSRRLLTILLVLLVLVFAIPFIVQAIIPIPPTYLLAGSTPVISGTSTETALPQVGFIGAQGQAITLEIAADYGASDEALSTLTSFEDKGSNALRNAAIDHLQDEERLAEVQRLLAGDTITTNQRAVLESEASNFVVAPVAVETFMVNQAPINIRILRGTTLEPIFEGVLTPGGDALTFTLPESGWYVLEKTADANSEGVTLIAAHGVSPILERTVTRDNGGANSGSINQFVQMTDRFLTEEPQPTVDTTANGTPIPFVVIIDHQYRGEASFGHYLRLYVAPFLNQINVAFLLIFVFTAAGYLVCRRVVDPTLSKPDQLTRPSYRIAMYLIFAAPPIAFVLMYGFTSFIASALALVLSGFATYLIAPKLNVFILSRWQTNSVAVQLLRTLISLLLIAVLFVVLYFVLNYLLRLLVPVFGGVLPVSNTSDWGGLMLTLFLAISGIVISFPIGILLALGRRSSLPVVSGFCTLYIEFVRGVPLITFLFMSQLLVPLISPALAEIDNVFRAMVGIILFSAAYLAENVRGGLQAIPSGQIEAAKAVGLNGAQITLHITLPQALRIVLPALVGQFISLLKDTSLVAIVGLVDLTGIADTVYAQTEFIGLRRETLLFITIIYFTMCYTIAALSRRIERTGSGVTRRQQL